jgi:hypothetical protein
VALLGIGISANTLIFSAVNALLLRSLPVAHPGNLVRIVEVHANGFVTWELPYGFCDAIPARAAGLSDVICQGEADLGMSDATSTERVRVHFVSPNFFSSLGVNAYLGRALTTDDARTSAMTAVLSYGFWQSHFGGDRNILGRRITLAGKSFIIVGVTPEWFNGLTVDTSPALRVPAAIAKIVLHPPPGMSPSAVPMFAEIFARLRDGVRLERADAEIDPQLHEAYEDEANRFFGISKTIAPDANIAVSRIRLESVATGISNLRVSFSHGLQVLMAAVGLILLMACANVAALLLAQSATRAQESKFAPL